MHIDPTFSSLFDDLYQRSIEEKSRQLLCKQKKEGLQPLLPHLERPIRLRTSISLMERQRAVFAKTGVASHSGLVRLMLNSAAPFAGEARGE